MKASIVALAIAVLVAACGGSSPSSPAPAQTPNPPPTAVTNWLVTQRFGSVTGPDNCWVNEQRARWTPAVFSGLPTSVARAESSVTLKSDFFQVNYSGTMSGSEFSTTGDKPLDAGGGVCQNGGGPFPQLAGVSKLTGRFSSDTVMTASEVNTYPLASGGTVIYTWEWQATRVP